MYGSKCVQINITKNYDCALINGSLIKVIDPKMTLMTVYHTFNEIS